MLNVPLKKKRRRRRKAKNVKYFTFFKKKFFTKVPNYSYLLTFLKIVVVVKCSACLTSDFSEKSIVQAQIWV